MLLFCLTLKLLLQGQTPYELLKGNRDMFLSEKVLEKLEEVDRKSRPSSICDRISKDKVINLSIHAHQFSNLCIEFKSNFDLISLENKERYDSIIASNCYLCNWTVTSISNSCTNQVCHSTVGLCIWLLCSPLHLQ